MTWPTDGLPRYVWAWDPQAGRGIPAKGYVYDRANCFHPARVVVAGNSHRNSRHRVEKICARMNAETES